MKIFSDKRIRNIFIASFVTLLFISFCIFLSRPRIPWGENNELRTDSKPIENRFPNLGHIDKCYWKLKVYGESRLSVGPTRFWMRGFAFVDSETLKSFKEKFTFKDMSSDWQPSLETEVLNIQSAKWSYSDEFSKYVRLSEIDRIYIDIYNGIVYFDCES